MIVRQLSLRRRRSAVAATSYPRSVGAGGPLAPMWDGPTLTVEEANRSTTCAVMIESAQALSHVEEIAAVDGVGQLFVGPTRPLALPRHHRGGAAR